jgi:hypothetical protein
MMENFISELKDKTIIYLKKSIEVDHVVYQNYSNIIQEFTKSVSKTIENDQFANLSRKLIESLLNETFILFNVKPETSLKFNIVKFEKTFKGQIATKIVDNFEIIRKHGNSGSHQQYNYG